MGQCGVELKCSAMGVYIALVVYVALHMLRNTHWHCSRKYTLRRIRSYVWRVMRGTNTHGVI